jgi:hypothetical protein
MGREESGTIGTAGGRQGGREGGREGRREGGRGKEGGRVERHIMYVSA